MTQPIPYEQPGWHLIPDWDLQNNPINGNVWYGWRCDQTFTYGSVLWVDNDSEPQPLYAKSSSMNLCVGYPKQVKFSYTSSNTGLFELKVWLGNQLIGTFTRSGGLAQSIFTPNTGVIDSESAHVLYNYWPVHPVNKEATGDYVGSYRINNNIWHDFTFIIPDYQGDASNATLTFEYTREKGVSRMVYLDNVEVYEIIPTPIPTSYNVNVPDCEPNSSYDLTTLEPTDTKYTYKWYRSTNPVMTNEVSDPTKAGVGTYYLFAKSKCAIVSEYSFPSAAVTVHPGIDCCEANVIRDGTFTETEASNSPTGYLVPVGDNTNFGGTYWKRNFTNKDDQFHIAQSYTDKNGKTLSKPLYMTYTSTDWNRHIYQNNPKISRWGKKIIEFDFVYLTSSLSSDFSVHLKPNATYDEIMQNHGGTRSFNEHVVEIFKPINATINKKWEFTNIPSGITVYVDGVKATEGERAYELDKIYTITIEVPANWYDPNRNVNHAKNNPATNHYGGILFWSSNNTPKYIDNVSVIVKNPDKPDLTNKTIAAGCPDGLANITTLASATNITNYLSGLQYRWFYENSSTGPMVADPLKVPAGTYYLFAFNPDTQCYSDTGEAVTVTQDCPVIKGTVYNDWDGASNGIHLQGSGTGAVETPLQNAKLYVLLVNQTTGKVAKSMQLNADGTYSFSGATDTQYYVMISEHEVLPGANAPSAPAYPAGTLPTGETLNGTLDGTADGKSTPFTTGANSSSVTTVNFGANRMPVQDNITFADCTTDNEKVITLSSLDSEPGWNNGEGKKLLISTVTKLTNGTFTYNGQTVSPSATTPFTIDAYNPSLLKFTRDDNQVSAELEFEYVFEDAAGQSLLNIPPGTGYSNPEPAKASFKLNALAVIADYSLTVESGEIFNYTPQHGGVDNNIIPNGTTYSWTRTTPLGVSGAESGTASANDGVTGKLVNFTSSPITVTYTVTAVTSPAGCESTFTITVTVNGVEFNCTDMVWYSDNHDNLGPTNSSIGTVTDDNPNVDPPSGFTTTGRYNINVNNMYGSSAIAVSRRASGEVYYIPSQGTSYASSIYLNIGGTSTEVAKLPAGVGNVKNLTFDKENNLWFIEGDNLTLYKLLAGELFSFNGTVIQADKWETVGVVTGLPTGTGIGDIEFNNGGSLYVLMESGALRIINPLELNNIYTPGTVEVDNIAYDITAPAGYNFSGYTFTGLATLSKRSSFLASAYDGTNSYFIELNMLSASGALQPRVTVTDTLSGVLIGDLASCAYIRNFWVGDVSTDGAHWDNWQQNLIPRNGESVEFADGVNTLEGIVAVRDLHVDGAHREAFNVINKSTQALVIPAGNTLIVHGKVGTSEEQEINDVIVVTMTSETNPDKVIIQAAPDKPVGNLLLKNSAYKDGSETIAATVQFYNKGYECVDCGMYKRSWQYFGIPVQTSTFPYADVDGNEVVNRWDEFVNGNKWSETSGTLNAFEGYEITRESTVSPETLTPNVYSFKGNLVTGNRTIDFGSNTIAATPRTLTFTSDVNYQGMNLIGNSYTGAIDILNGLTFTGKNDNTIEATVYLFNTGTRDEWRKLNGSAASGLASGQYLTVPQNLAGQTATDGTGIALPAIIPSMHAFFVKVKGTSPAPSLTIDYSKLTKNEKVIGTNNEQVAWRSTTSPEGEEGSSPKATPLPNVVIDVLGMESADRVWLFQQPGTTQGFDNGWDGEKIIEAGLAQIYVAGSDGNSYQVATVGDMADTRLGFTAEMNGKYTLEFSVSPEIAARNLSLVDTRTGTRITLRDGGNTALPRRRVITGNASRS